MERFILRLDGRPPWHECEGSSAIRMTGGLAQPPTRTLTERFRRPPFSIPPSTTNHSQRLHRHGDPRVRGLDVDRVDQELPPLRSLHRGRVGLHYRLEPARVVLTWPASFGVFGRCYSLEIFGCWWLFQADRRGEARGVHLTYR